VTIYNSRETPPSSANTRQFKQSPAAHAPTSIHTTSKASAPDTYVNMHQAESNIKQAMTSWKKQAFTHDASDRALGAAWLLIEQ
jgi:hypothetical protein